MSTSRRDAIGRSAAAGAAAACGRSKDQISAPSAAPYRRKCPALARPRDPQRPGAQREAQVEPDRVLDNRRWEPMPAIEKLSHRSCYPAHRSRSTDIPVTRPSGGLPTLAKRFLRPLPLLQHEKQQQPTAAQPFALLHRQKYAFMDGTGLAGCGKSRDFGKTVMKRARNGNPGLIKSTGYEGAKGDESGWKHHRPTFSAAC